MSEPEAVRAGWLPIDLLPAGAFVTNATVRWMEFGDAALAEPFFNQTVDRLRATKPPAREWETGLDALVREADCLPEVKPAGFIFHVSHCGSTLLANALRTAEGVQVVCESRFLTQVLLPVHVPTSDYMRERWSSRLRAVLGAFFSLFAHHPDGRAHRLVIKTASTSLLSMGLLRSLFPDTPCVVLIRDPAEVIVANMQIGGGWFASKEMPESAGRLFGFKEPVAAMPVEEYAARVVGALMNAALASPVEGTMLVDYEDLNERRMREIASFFGLELPLGSERLEPVFGYYAKDPAQRQKFEDDRARKRDSVTPELRAASRRWAMPAYNDLRAR